MRKARESCKPAEVAAKARLRQEIEAELKLTAASTGVAALSPKVAAAFAKVPREQFVPLDLAPLAYDNRPLPIGQGQTISQPFIVLLMTELLALKPTDRVLEIGTGSGYQAALLAELAASVHTIECRAELAEAARAALQAQGYANIQFRTGDGAAGWPEAAPFDAIIATAATPKVPPAWTEQLAVGGRLLLPLGESSPWGGQILTRIDKQKDGALRSRSLLDVAFVPLV